MWGCTPLIPGGKDKHKGQGKYGLHSEFQASLEHKGKTVFGKKKKKTSNKIIFTQKATTYMLPFSKQQTKIP